MKTDHYTNQRLLTYKLDFLKKKFGEANVNASRLELERNDVNVLSPLGCSELYLKLTGIPYSYNTVTSLAEKICSLQNMRTVDISGLQQRFGIDTISLWSLWIICYNMEDTE